MIKLNKQLNAPKVLLDHQSEWTRQLLDEVTAYGHYSKIPKEKKDKILANYRHKDIKKDLFDSSNDKCAFCESKPAESGNIEVEHFAPKSIYPEKTFEWSNLLPACRKCNEAKDTHDTISEPILNPYDYEPESCIVYDYLEIKAKKDAPLYDLAKLTIEVCDLNATRLITARAEILVTLSGYIQQLKSTIVEIEAADTERKRRNKLINLRNSLELAQRLTLPTEKYSAYCKYFLSSQESYVKAIELAAELEASEV